MARKTTVALEDDVDGGPAEETLRFGIDAAEYEIDLSATNASRFRRQMEPFIEHARKTAQKSRRSNRTTASRKRSSEVRAWARKQGIEVSDRGRMPASVIAQYEAATRKA